MEFLYLNCFQFECFEELNGQKYAVVSAIATVINMALFVAVTLAVVAIALTVALFDALVITKALLTTRIHMAIKVLINGSAVASLSVTICMLVIVMDANLLF